MSRSSRPGSRGSPRRPRSGRGRPRRRRRRHRRRTWWLTGSSSPRLAASIDCRVSSTRFGSGASEPARAASQRRRLVGVAERHPDHLPVAELVQVGRAQIEREPARLAPRAPPDDGHDEVPFVDALLELRRELVESRVPLIPDRVDGRDPANARGRIRGMLKVPPLDVGVVVGEGLLAISPVEGRVAGPHDLHVLLGHLRALLLDAEVGESVAVVEVDHQPLHPPLLDVEDVGALHRAAGDLHAARFPATGRR